MQGELEGLSPLSAEVKPIQRDVLFCSEATSLKFRELLGLNPELPEQPLFQEEAQLYDQVLGRPNPFHPLPQTAKMALREILRITAAGLADIRLIKDELLPLGCMEVGHFFKDESVHPASYLKVVVRRFQMPAETLKLAERIEDDYKGCCPEEEG